MAEQPAPQWPRCPRSAASSRRITGPEKAIEAIVREIGTQGARLALSALPRGPCNAPQGMSSPLLFLVSG
jgi:hypothetical protein